MAQEIYKAGRLYSQLQIALCRWLLFFAKKTTASCWPQIQNSSLGARENAVSPISTSVHSLIGIITSLDEFVTKTVNLDGKPFGAEVLFLFRQLQRAHPHQKQWLIPRNDFQEDTKQRKPQCHLTWEQSSSALFCTIATTAFIPSSSMFPLPHCSAHITFLSTALKRH